ncbi:hypothetical protein CSE45_5483 [Citreicella sp. SE45]|nr:hypothetical protein CSE45_5483 [Citreicella sp. SE45]
MCCVFLSVPRKAAHGSVLRTSARFLRKIPWFSRQPATCPIHPQVIFLLDIWLRDRGAVANLPQFQGFCAPRPTHATLNPR